MSNIYKVITLDKDNIKNIFIFNGYNYQSKERLKNTDSEQSFIDKNMENEKVKIIEDVFIYDDDTIYELKRKIIENCFENKKCMEELYLCGRTKNIVTSYDAYQTLTKNSQYKITQNVLYDYFKNIVNDENYDFETLEIEEKSNYSYIDLLNINFKWENEYMFFRPLDIIYKTIDFLTNPYSVTEINKKINDNYGLLDQNLDKNLIFENNIHNNTIYCFLAEDVLVHYSDKSESLKNHILKLYYPKLRDSENNIINTNENLIIFRKNKIDEMNEKFNKIYKDNIKNIDLFYKIYNNLYDNSKEYYIKKGIKNIELTIKYGYDFKIPLEILFKLINSNIIIPFIKYKSEGGKGIRYRFYSDKLTITGKKVPYLFKENRPNPISEIMKINRFMGKDSSVSFYILCKDDNVETMICEISRNGNININISLKSPEKKEYINKLIDYNINNNIINIFSKFLNRSGHTYKKFTTIDEINIIINDLVYIYQIDVPRSVMKNNYNLEKWNCLISLFSNFKDKQRLFVNNEINLNYKRVSKFKKLDKIDAKILDLEFRGYIPIRIKDYLMTENDGEEVMTEKEAKEAWGKYIKNEEGIHNPLQFNIKKVKTQGDGYLEITINKIKNLKYLKFVNIFTFVLYIIFQRDPSLLGVYIKEFNRKCGKVLKEVDDSDYFSYTSIEKVIEQRSDENRDDGVFDQDNGEDIDEYEEYSEEDDDDTFDETKDVLEKDVKKIIKKVRFNIAQKISLKKDDDEVSSLEEEEEEEEEDDDFESDSDYESGSKSDDEKDSFDMGSSSSNDTFTKFIGGASMPDKRGIWKIGQSNSVFKRKREILAPELFNSGNHKGTFKYASSCQFDQGKQPIMITEDEKKK